MSNEKLHGIILGAGFMGSTHLDCYAKMPDVVITGIVDKNTEKGSQLASKYPKCSHFTTIEEAISVCKPDFADICLPTALHIQAALSTLQNGIHILIEKPFALNTKEADSILEVADKFKKRVMVAHVCRFMREYQYAKEVVESGELGKLLSAAFDRESDTPLWSAGNWLQNKQSSGGTILDLSIHDIDIANWFLGKPVEFSCVEIESKRIPGASCVSSVLGYENGASAYITANHLMPKGYPLTASYRLVFENGALEWNTANTKKDYVARYMENVRNDIFVSSTIPKESPYFIQLRSFIDNLKTGEAFAISAEEARLAVHSVNELNRFTRKSGI